jgi:hypothetical protein
LPKASNFYISYFILYNVAQTALYLLQPIGLVTVFIFFKFAKTPRKKYKKVHAIGRASLGLRVPKMDEFGDYCYLLCHHFSARARVSAVGLGLIYLACWYNMLYVHNMQISTKGTYYGRALQQLLVGVYLAKTCLLGLFGIGIGSSVSAVGPVVIQFILIVATIAFHITLRSKLGPLLETLPLNLLIELQKRKHNDSSVAERGHAYMNRNGNGHTSTEAEKPVMKATKVWSPPPGTEHHNQWHCSLLP